MHALLIGATGATGKDLLDLLLTDAAFGRVTIFVRRPVAVQHEKLTVHVIDFDRPETWKSLVKGDVLFSCLGTTLQAAGSKAAQWTIDYEYQYAFAAAAREAGVPTYVLVSAGFASPKSVFYYSKMKGQLEVAVQKLQFPRLAIFQPPLLLRKGTDRSGEMLSARVLRFLNGLGLFRSAKPMPTEVLAQAMIRAAKSNRLGHDTFSGPEIWELAGKNK